jgi:hypothetical protein
MDENGEPVVEWYAPLERKVGKLTFDCWVKCIWC